MIKVLLRQANFVDFALTLRRVLLLMYSFIFTRLFYSGFEQILTGFDGYSLRPTLGHAFDG